jgi:tetratricopeptide (TPR) repeat protein
MTDASQLHTQAINAFNRRDWPRAQALSLQLLPLAAQSATTHYIAGVASLELGQLPHALKLLHRAVMLEPKRADVAAQFAKALCQARLFGEALSAADNAMRMAPTDPLTLDTLGVVYTLTHAHGRAVALFRRAVMLMPQSAHHRFNLATSLIAAGEIDAAEQEAEACLQLEPRFWRAHMTVAHLRKQTLERNHLARLHSLLPDLVDEPSGQLNVNLALAKEYEDLANYPVAFEHLTRGKAAGKAGRGYTIARDEALFEALIRAFPEPSTATQGHPSEEPIFVIGMPRSGTTLVERIISSHPDVYSAGELQNFSVVCKQASGSTTRPMLDLDLIERVDAIDWGRLGESYLASTRPMTGHTPRFIDKLPHNFLYAGFIAGALPRAKIVCLRRNPMDTCLSNFRQLFALSSPYFDYSFDLLDTGRYYLLFDRLMAHWEKVLPGRILQVDYETLVNEQEATSRRLLAHCDLPWDDACLRFEDNRAPVATASAVQVREPIFRTSIQRWKKYEAQLHELRDLLLEGGICLTD